MPIIQSSTTLIDMPANWWPTRTNTSLRLYEGLSMDYSVLYRTQLNVRTCVDFLARNIAHLGLHVYRRDKENDRVRLRDHPMAKLINLPLPAEFKVTRFRLIETLMGDLGVYFNAYWLKIQQEGRLTGLLRIPPELVTVRGSLKPTEYEINLGGPPKRCDPNEIVHFRGYNAEDAVRGLSPLETLRRILAEEHAAGDYRENFWQNAARMNGVILRPADAPEWGDAARARFKGEFEALYAGADNSGKTAILEEGMDWKAISFNPKDTEYLAGRQLTREECARAYHIPPPLVGILTHATYSNISEQHKGLYTDVLGPWIGMIEQDIELQVLPEFEDIEGVYLEFNIQEKLQGDFETQTKSLQSAIGRPWMTANEGRGIMNLPRIVGGDELVTPLNVLVGGQASPNDSAPDDNGKGGRRPPLQKAEEDEPISYHDPERREKYEEKWRRLLVRTFERQRNAVLPRLGTMNDINLVWEDERWNSEVTEDFTKLSLETALDWARLVAGLLESELNQNVIESYVSQNARIAAEYMNASTREQVETALAAEDPKLAIGEVFALALSVRALQLATGRVTTLSNYGAYAGAIGGGVNTKTWVVRSTNPRDSHRAINGETVRIRDRFSNGLRWPGDPQGSAEENANCMCEVVYNR